MKSIQTFTFSYTGINTPEGLLTTTASHSRNKPSSSPQRIGDMASRVSALLLLGLICVGFAAGKIPRVETLSECIQCSCMYAIPTVTFQMQYLVKEKHVIFSPAVHLFLVPQLCLTLFTSLFLQLRLYQTAAKTNLPRCFRSSVSKATAFRKLGAVVTSAPLCECQILKRLAEVVRAL